VICIILSSCKSISQTEVKYNPIVQKAKETSLYADNLDWNEINIQFNILINSGDKENALQFLLNSLNDKHASFRSVIDQSIVVSYKGNINSKDIRNPKFVNEVINDITAKFEYAQLDNEVGYLKVVGIAPGVVEENAKLIRNGLIELKNKKVKKWIVDLRYNGGGDMNPMISGLAPLIGEGFIGGSVDNQDSVQHEYSVKEGQFYDNDRLVVELQNSPIIGDEEKVVVLLSKYTISSGELVAVVFKGRPNTYFLGEGTAGFTTGNGWEQVSDELIMCISESVFIDRNRVKYDDRVNVDENSDFKENIETEGDRQILRAIDWLQKE